MKTYILAAILLASPLAAGAATDYFLKIDTIEGESDTKAPSRATTTTSTSVQSTESSSQAGGNVEFEWKVEEGESAQNESEESGEKGGTEDINIGVGELQENRGGVSVAAGDVNGLTEEEKREFLLSVKAHAELRSEQDLENFAKGVLLEDENVEELSLNYEKIKVSYRMPAKFLGMLDSELKADLEVSGEGEVTIKYPWFAFLYQKLVGTAELEAEVEAAIGTGSEKWLRGNLGSHAEVAGTFTSLSNVLKTRHDLALNSETSVEN